MNDVKVHEVKTAEELQAVLKLRYEILRAPWNQPADTATDDKENESINAFISDENKNVLACARLQKNSETAGQVRFMAVADAQQGKGLGKIIIQYLEKRAIEMGLLDIELQARENAVDFYKSCGYTVAEKTFNLWNVIQHYRMVKRIKN